MTAQPIAARFDSPSFVTGLFPDAERARAGFELLVKESFDPHEVSVLHLGDDSIEAIPVEHKSGVPVGVTAGASLGGTLGIAGAVALGGPLGLALFASGPILAALQGAVIGAAGGGLLGALAGLAFWWDEPELESELARGAVFLGVTAEGERAYVARKALLAAGATRIFG